MIIPANHHHRNEVWLRNGTDRSQPLVFNEVVMLSIKVHNQQEDFPLKKKRPPIPTWTSHFHFKRKNYRRTRQQIIAGDKERHMANTSTVGFGFTDKTAECVTSEIRELLFIKRTKTSPVTQKPIVSF